MLKCIYLGAVVQLGEHHTGSVDVRGSSPLSSTSIYNHPTAGSLLIHLLFLIRSRLICICTLIAAIAIACIFVCVSASGNTPRNNSAEFSHMSAPQVLILVWAGAGWTDLVSINYDGLVSEKSVRNDLEAISKDTGWTINNLHISTKKIPVPGSNLSTSATFDTNTGLASGSASVNIDPIILVYKRFDRIQISFLVGKATPINAPNGYTDENISITSIFSPGNLQYAINIIDHDITKLDWPYQQGGGAVPSTGKRTGWGIVIILLLAGGGALVAYLTAKKLTCR